MKDIYIDFWGVRGSVPSPGSETIRYGGNTSCISITVENKILILDAGTGIRNLGSSIIGQSDLKNIYHNHPHSLGSYPRFSIFYTNLSAKPPSLYVPDSP